MTYFLYVYFDCQKNNFMGKGFQNMSSLFEKGKCKVVTKKLIFKKEFRFTNAFSHSD